MHAPRPMQKTLQTLMIALPLVIASCAPAETAPPPRVGTGVVGGPQTTFYPSSTGLSWTYLPSAQDGSIDPAAPPYELRIDGPRSFQGKVLIAHRFFGRTQNITYFREIGEQGVRLHGLDSPDFVTVSYDPPILEYPPEGRLVNGYSWGGDTQVTTVTVRGQQVTATMRYQYKVLGTEKYRIGESTYDTIAINYEATISTGEKLGSVIYFAPRIGEIRTKEGLVLWRKNF